MRRGAKPTKPNAEAKPSVARKSANDDSRVRDLEKRLSESLEREKEALGQQTATSEILRVISRSQTDLQPVFDTIVASAVRLCHAHIGAVFQFDGELIHLVAHHNFTPEMLDAVKSLHPKPPQRDMVSGRAILSRAVVQIEDVLADREYHQDVALATSWRSMVGVPMLREGEPVGAIVINRVEPGPFADNHLELLQTFADQAVIAIENVRLFKELEEKNRALTDAHAQVSESLEQQTATAEILSVISGSPTDIRPVFDALLDRALTLCEASHGSLYQLEDGALRHVGVRGIGAITPIGGLLSLESAPGWAVLEKRTVHIEDVREVLDRMAPAVEAGVRRAGIRTVAAVPLLREQTAIGAIFIRRHEVRPFSEKQIRLLQTFADQAVIAIENVRLFKELEASNRDLATALDKQTATSEILRAMSGSLTDVQPVFDTIVGSGLRLLGGYSATMMLLRDGDSLDLVAYTSTSAEADASLVDAFPLPLHSLPPGERAVHDRRPHAVEDVESAPDVTNVMRETGRARGWHSNLFIPMIRKDVALGLISITRRDPGPFAADEIALLQTFADQAVIAIENVRLFTELQERNREVEQKSRQLAAASQHKSEFLANMSHELRTPLNAIIGYSELLEEEAGDLDGGRLVPDLQKIAVAAKHQLSLINDILDLSKVEAGRMELELSEFDLATALDGALTLVRERAGRRSIALEMTVDSRVGQVRGDERKVRQALLNLLSNAIKFTPEGGRIEVRAAPRAGSVEVSVSDTGIGIAPEEQEKVFEEFRQVGAADKKVEGTGLGLALARKFVELHGGRIWVESEVGEGATFTFTLPAGGG